MKVIKIQDGVIIKKSSLSEQKQKEYNEKGSHTYIARYDSKKDKFYMHPTSHYIDPKKNTEVKKGIAILMRIKGLPELSTVYKQPRRRNIHGQFFDSKFNKYEEVSELTKYQIQRLNKFIKTKPLQK